MAISGGFSKISFTFPIATGATTKSESIDTRSLPRRLRDRLAFAAMFSNCSWVRLLRSFDHLFCALDSLTGGEGWQSHIWALAMFSKGSSVYCADGIGACPGSRSRHRKLLKRCHYPFAPRRLHHLASFAVSKLQRTYSLVRQHPDSELCLFAWALPPLQEADFCPLSVRRSSYRSRQPTALSEAWTDDRVGNLPCILGHVDCPGFYRYRSPDPSRSNHTEWNLDRDSRERLSRATESTSFAAVQIGRR